MQSDFLTAERAIRLLLYLAGAISTLVLSWVTSKIRVYHDNRKLHHDDLKQRVLLPVRDGLESKYRTLVWHGSPVVTEVWGTIATLRVSTVTEQPQSLGPVLSISDPRGEIEARIDEVLLQDAKDNHYAPLDGEWERFRDAWSEHARRCEAWVAKMASQILKESHLSAHLAPFGQPYVMHLRLACFVYMRLFNLPVGPVRKIKNEQGGYWLQNSGTLATGSEEQIDGLIQLLDSMVEMGRSEASAIRQESQQLGGTLNSLIRKFSLALAEQKLRRRCGIVTFF